MGRLSVLLAMAGKEDMAALRLPNQPHNRVQRHVVSTLVVTQMLGGVGMSAGVAVGALLAEDVSGSARWAVRRRPRAADAARSARDP